MKNKNGMFENDTQMTADGVLILHILSLLGEPVPDTLLTEIIMGPGLVNYFTAGQCLSALVDAGYASRSLDSMGKALYDITESGRGVYESLKYMLGGGLGAAYESYIRCHRDDIKKRTKIDATWTQDTKGNFFVHCFVRDGMRAVVDITLPVADKQDADYIVNAWKNNSSKLYFEVLKKLLNRS
ncbi:MAG: DUF4364 family protein [Clostridia bacterium]|nr:DUF4364 family protein [Clostridia bacterium]